MSGGLGIIAGQGELPRLIAGECARRGMPHLVVAFEGAGTGGWAEAHPHVRLRFEKPGRLFAALRGAGCDRVTFAGAMSRPRLDPLRFDLTALRLAPRILPLLRQGDDATLRGLAAVFEAEGFVVEPAHTLLEGLLCAEGVPTRARPDEQDRADAARAARLVAAIGAADAGQAAVVAGGLCLGLESIQGTDALLDFVAATAGPFRDGARGVLYKAPKPGQDWRMDLPAIGPETVRRAAAAGLAGIALQAGGVLVLGQEETVAEADRLGLFLWGRPA
ncbi:MAG: phosphatidate cytidylyltransferase [Paracoccaceae bacterium]|nr:MAG: phosphatidate cytidylyltransferase [Paracoccaceae bacterium]